MEKKIGEGGEDFIKCECITVGSRHTGMSISGISVLLGFSRTMVTHEESGLSGVSR